MLSSMDHLFSLRIHHVLILVPASLRDLHRHSCRHFHFHFWLSLRRSYLHFVSRWISFLSPSPSLARAFVRFCFPPLSSVLLFLSFFPLSFPLLFFLSSPAFLCSAHFLFSRWNMRARVRRQSRPLLFVFPRVLRPCDLLEASPGEARRGPREHERISSTAPREIDELRHREIERSGEKGTRWRNVKFRELIRSVGVSEVARRAFKGPAAVFIELAKVNLLAPRKLGHRHCAAWSKQDKQPLRDSKKNMEKESG